MSESGYYRVQVAPNLHILSLNTLYFNSLDTYEDTVAEKEQLLWLEQQFINSALEDKFIIISHIYESAHYETESFNNWMENDSQTWYY